MNDITNNKLSQHALKHLAETMAKIARPPYQNEEIQITGLLVAQAHDINLINYPHAFTSHVSARLVEINSTQA